MRNFVVTVLIVLGTPAFAQDPQGGSGLTFQAWKDQQVLEAQNQALRIAARISTLRAGRQASGHAKKEELANGKLKKVSETETLSAAEQDLKRAQESLESANALQFSDYADIYIPSLADQPEALSKLMERLSKDELSQIVRSQMARGTPGNAKHNAIFAEALNSAKTK